MVKWFSNSRNKILVFFVVLFSLILSFLFLKSPSLGESFMVVEVVDGDTIKLEDGRTIRYLGVDTPEEKQCFSQEAETLNRESVLNKSVRVEMDINEMDRFGRYLAYIYVQGEGGEEIFVNQYLIGQGAGEFFLDTVNLRYQDILIKTAEQSHQEKKGLWRACAPDPEIGCLVKGNYDISGHRWYHLPSFRHYDLTVVNLENGDRWFCSEAEAQTAGFKRSRE